MKMILIYFIVFISAVKLFSQNYLSELNSELKSPIYTTYASSIENSKYSMDQGYHLVWFDPEKSITLQTDQSGSLGIIFKSQDLIRSTLSQYSQPPIITTSYGNLFRLFYFPYPSLRAEYFGVIRDSETLILDVILSNEGSVKQELDIYPFIGFETQNLTGIKKLPNGIQFSHRRKSDSWMKEHNIPYQEELINYFSISEKLGSSGIFQGLFDDKDTSGKFLINSIAKNSNLATQIGNNESLAVLHIKIELSPGQSKKIRIIRKLFVPDSRFDEAAFQQLFKEDLNDYLIKNEKLYQRIPRLKFTSEDHKALYWNSFNLIRQCFMPPEGKSSYNYYVFSREPKWGWGYGGQVFHESLTMLAYAYMDPISAMNSQRVYFERQHPNGYINYRTGPYLDEQIETNGQLTSSAPWFNWQNYEIYKVTRDKKFLQEAYQSGKKFYEYYTTNRDSDNDGLCEWGAHAELESVRDARVAVWDEVGSPDNYEALDCNIMLVSEAKALADMAQELGILDDVSRFRKDALQRTYLINKFMWDEETGFYYHVNKKDHTFTLKNENDIKRKEIIAFLALWGGVADKQKAERLMQHFNNPDEFYRNYGVPTLSADDPYYNPIGYWNGPIWLPWQYLVFRGLIDYGYIDEAKDLTRRISENAAHQLKTNHYFWEFYSADDLQAGWNKTYIWSGILARFYIDLDNLK